MGPLLFNLFINDISSCFRYCKFLLYADDLKIFRRIDSQVCAASLQRDLSSFENWCTLNSLDLNLSKCHILRFYKKNNLNVLRCDCVLGNSPLSEVEFVRDLGVMFSSDLTFNRHYRGISALAYKKLGFIFPYGKDFGSVRTLKILDCVLVRPILEYCSII